ncbi:MAG: glutathione peroxidase, partial [Solirubrobacteraceae bacterium]
SVQEAAGSSDRAAPARERVRERASSGVLRGTFERLNGRRDDLARYRGDVVLVVNTATECGFSPQFAGLEQLYRKHKSRGLAVLGFPANDFAQEPRSNGEIATFCKENYGVSFPMFARTTVTGDGANPLYRRLAAKAGAPDYNFNKYLVDRRGKVVARYGAGVDPASEELAGRVEKLL